jgi:hypothetical protein
MYLKLIFWNVQRLSANSNEERKKIIIDTALTRVSPDFALFCELLQTNAFPAPYNLTYRKESDRQLCYGCIGSDGSSYNLDKFTPAATDEYKAAVFKGGNDFTELADRAVGLLGTVKGVDIYVIHAPASSNSAQKAMAFVACDLNKRYGNKPWLLVGDFNVEPEKLASSKTGIRLADLIVPPDWYTKIGKTKNKKYDYVLTNWDKSKVSVRVIRSGRDNNSDHYPIYVELWS